MNHHPATSTTLGRRSFLIASTAVGGGLMLGFSLPSRAADAPARPEINAWVVVQPDDTVIIRVARTEMGQGANTALPMIVAEELDCDWANVKPEMVAAEDNLRRDKVYKSMGTYGSLSVRQSQDYLRKAGASARAMLVAAAAEQWKVPAADCTTEKGVVTHKASGRTLKYGAVATRASRLSPPETVTLKDPATWSILGSETIGRNDIHDKILGKPVYAIDVRIPDMLYAAIVHAPVFGGSLKSYDEKVVAGRPGVHQVVALGNAVAVVGDTYWHASQAVRALPVTWDDGAHGKVSSATIAADIADGLSTSTEVGLGRHDGDVPGTLAKATKVITADYSVPYLSHAPMETMNCTARFTGDKLEVWAPTQDAMGTLDTAAKAAGIPPLNVICHPTLAGGGFGRRGGGHDFVDEAVKIAKAVGRPVQLIWSREQDIQHDFYRPISAARMKAGLDAQGNLLAWDTRIAGHSINATQNPEALKKGPDKGFLVSFTNSPYDVAHQRVDYGMRNSHLPVGYWRSVNEWHNGFFRECFLDEIAHAAGQDPFELRRKLLAKSPKDLGILEKVADVAGWGKPLPEGVFRGIAQVDGYGSHSAAVAEVSVKDGRPVIHRVVIGLDCGYVAHPGGARAQLEGAVLWSLQALYYGEITVRDGRIEQGNFHDYRMPLLRDMPKVEVVLAPTGGFWGGVGEPGAPTVAPAVLNAFFLASGKRLRAMPILAQGPRSA